MLPSTEPLGIRLVSTAECHALLEWMILVTEEDIWKAVATAYQVTGFPIEPAAAAGPAALDACADHIPDGRIGIMLTGGRTSPADLCRALSEQPG